MKKIIESCTKEEYIEFKGTLENVRISSSFNAFVSDVLGD